MLNNYHMHTYRCGHAVGTEREMALAASANGLRTAGFSDHSPFPGVPASSVRMAPEEIGEYVENVLAMKEELKGKTDILLGFELEYFEPYFPKVMKMYEKYPVEYLLLGQHYLGDDPYGHYVGRPCGEAELTQYVDQSIEGMNTGVYLYFAHPDLPFFIGPDDYYRREMTRLCEAAARLDMPLEINILGMRTGRNYPNEAFWEIAGKVGNRVVLGLDAHSPEGTKDEASEKKACEWAERFGFTIETELKLK
ncbi:MAG: histidinol-phosphatase [Firmicutes bacterium]|nr:histidinol-phosphatase [Bacillota bacterium]